MSDIVHISKFLSLVLRHKPSTIGIVLDKNGYADVQDLIRLCSIKGVEFDFNILETVVRDNNKKRFVFNENKTKIRANQGHSITVDLQLKPVQPPVFLYHGTATRFIDSISRKGLIPGSRQHVHLSKDKDTAINVGSRHGSPVVLIVEALKMHDAGYKFFLSENNVWLTDSVPVKYIKF